MKKNKQNQQIFNVPDWTLFSSLETIHQTVGVEDALLAKLVAKELTDNALDSGGKCTVGLLENNGFYVEDDGNGIPGTDEEIAALFSIIRDLRSSKLLRLPTRGALGNGLRFVTGLVLSTEGTLTVSTRGRKLQLSPQRHNGETQYERLDDYQKDGTRIEVTLPGLNLSNVFEWADKAISLSGRGKGYKGQTSPFWYSLDSFLKLVHALSSEKTKKITIEFIRNFDGCSGRAKAKEIYNSITRKLIKEFTKSDAQKLLEMMRESTEPIAAKKLGYVGELEGFEVYHSLCNEYTHPESKEKMTGSIPYVLEVWASRSDETLPVTLCVNRTPITDFIGYSFPDKLNITGCGLYFELEKLKFPIKLWINILTPYIPIMSGAKEPHLKPMEESIKETVEMAFKKLMKKNKPSKKKTRKKTHKAVVIANLQTLIDKASDSGRFRYSIRQLFYVARPIVKDETGGDLQYSNFTKIITAHELEQERDLPNIYRDSRGTIYHPHLKETIQLGTLNVEKYKKPEWAFNKILYCEKEGFLEILISAQWPERHDCVLLTSKGYASGAARDILDLIGESNEDIMFFCIHDADREGTLIFQSLTEATAARPSRKVKVINLGLEPRDVEEMGLPVEEVQKNNDPAKYVSDEDKSWFTTNRVELNAMDTRTFIKWLDDKMDEYAKGKLIPPDDVINDELHTIGEAELRNRIRKIIMKEANIDERVEKSYTNKLPFATKKFTERRNDLKEIIREDLKKEPTHLWKNPVESLVDKILSDMQFS